MPQSLISTAGPFGNLVAVCKPVDAVFRNHLAAEWMAAGKVGIGQRSDRHPAQQRGHLMRIGNGGAVRRGVEQPECSVDGDPGGLRRQLGADDVNER